MSCRRSTRGSTRSSSMPTKSRCPSTSSGACARCSCLQPAGCPGPAPGGDHHSGPGWAGDRPQDAGRRMTWWQALIAAGAVPGSGGKGDEPEAADDADLVEGAELQAYSVGPAQIPAEVSFLNGIERWSVVAYDGVAPIVSAFVAAAVRRRDKNGVLHTTSERTRAFAIAPLERMSPPLREILEQSGRDADVEPMDGELVGQPARYLEQVESTVRRVRAHLERELAEACIDKLGAAEWLVLDGLLSRSPAVARHPRALGVIKSHGAQFLEGRGLERALTLPAGHRTGAGRSARASGDGHAGSSAECVAVGRACASRDARDTLGPPVVSFTSRGGI